MALREVFLAASLKQNGSVTPVILPLTIPAWANHAKIYSIRLLGEDDAVTDADGTFLNLNQGPAAALTNGIECGIFDAANNLILDLFGGLVNAKNNSDMVGAGWDYTEITYAAGDSLVYVELKPATPLIITGTDKFAVRINDDLTAFTKAYITTMSKLF